MSDPQGAPPIPTATIPAEEHKTSEAKIFLSHKTVDRSLASEFKTALVELGFKKDDIFLSEEISPSLPWHNTIFEALRSCETLFFLYTDPSLDWDWCLFECGFFAGLSDVKGPPRKLICINAGIGRPSPLAQWQDVSSPETLRDVLTVLAAGTQSDLPSRSEFSTFVTSLWNSFTHHIPQKADPRYLALQQRRMSVTVSSEAMNQITSGRSIDQGVKIEISDGAREIFVNAPLESKWSEFIATLAAPGQTDWAEAIPITIRMLNGTRTASPMLPLVKSNTEAPVLFRPSIVQRDFFSGATADPLDTNTRYTIIFIRTPDATMAGQNREDRLYHWLMLGRNFREAIIDGYSKKIMAPALKHEDVRHLTQDLLDEIALTRIDSNSRGLNLEEDLKLFCKESVRAISLLADRWEQIERDLRNYKALARGLVDPPEDQVQALISDIKKALQAIREVNEAFTLHATCALMSSVASAS